MLSVNTAPSADDLEKLVKLAACFEDKGVIDVMLFAYMLGCFSGSTQGERFGTEMIAELRKNGAFE